MDKNASRRFDLRAFVRRVSMILTLQTKALRSKRREAFLSILSSCYTTLDAKLLETTQYEAFFYIEMVG